LETANAPSNPKTADEAMKQLLQSKIGGFNPMRMARFLQIKRNIAYLCGHQNIYIENGEIYTYGEDDPSYCPVMHNKILEGVGNDIASGTKNEPISFILPAGTDEDDKATAKACEKIKQYLYRINSMQEIRKGAILWYDLDGIGWTKVYFDPMATSMGENPPKGQDGNDPNTADGAARFQGEVIVDVIPNTELIYDRRNTRPDKLKWMIHVKTVTLGFVASQFGPEFAAKAEKYASDSIPATDTFETSLMGDFATLAGNMSGTKGTGKIPNQDRVLTYYEFWHIPDVLIPMGAYAIAVGSSSMVGDVPDIEIANNMPYPINTYRHGKLPFIPWRPLALDGIDGGGISRISQAIPLQREYNKIINQIGENNDVMGNGLFFATRDANLDTKRLSNTTGIVIEYDGAQNKPTREQGISAPGGIFAHLQMLGSMIDNVFMFHESSQGKMPQGGPRSAVGLQTLQDADSTQMGPIVRALDIAEEQVVHQMLNLALATYGQRTLNIIGDDNQWTLQAIDTEELQGKINVIIKTGSSAPYSKEAQTNKIFMVWQSGLLQQPMDPTRIKVLKAMDLGNFDNLLQDNSKDINFAQREFQAAEQQAAEANPSMTPEEAGKVVFMAPPNAFDDHNTHIVEHSNFLKSKYWEYMGSGNMNLMLLANVENIHIQMHQQILAQQQLHMAMMANPGAFNKQNEDEETKSKSDESK
jgi:hypothetical protein